ncbi:MAG TPA: hypothetical protein VJ813_02780 [Vicinamibacterales bacterium]|nr:hypothetical protein [Vicinamibacterales bacterium]
MRTLVFAVALLCVAPLAAQEGSRATVAVEAPIFIQPGAQTPLRVAKVGTSLKVLQEEGEWVEVEFSDPQFGRRVGWVQKKLVRIFRPELEPMDLSVKSTAPVPEVRRALPPPQQAQELSPVTRDAAPRRERGWLDINIGGATSAQRSLNTETSISDGQGEFETYRVGYNSPAGGSFDFGGGFMFTPLFGFGIQFTGTAHQDTADLSIRIPHPLYFDSHADDSGFTDQKLDRVEGGVNLSLVAAIPSNNRNLTFRVYGGPTYFRLEADAVNNIRYLQQFGIFTTANSVDITSFSSEKVEQSGWGLHAGADLGYFFSRHFGVGGFARATRGTVTFSPADFAVTEDLDVKVGGFQAGGGLRIRF